MILEAVFFEQSHFLYSIKSLVRLYSRLFYHELLILNRIIIYEPHPFRSISMDIQYKRFPKDRILTDILIQQFSCLFRSWKIVPQHVPSPITSFTYTDEKRHEFLPLFRKIGGKKETLESFSAFEGG